MKVLLSSAAFLALASTASFAADLGRPVPMPSVVSQAYFWNGAYIGVTGGVGWLKSDISIPAYPSNFDFTTTSGNVGGHLGYNYQFSPNWMAGVDAAAVALWNSGSHNSGAVGGGESYRVDAKWKADIDLRLGYITGNTLFYAKGGVSFLGLDNMNFVPAFFGGKSSVFTGGNIGAGIEYAFAPNWTIGADYDFAAFEQKKFTYFGAVDVKPSVQTLNLTLNYKF